LAALNASMALKKLSLAQAEEEVKNLTSLEADLDRRIQALGRERKALATASQENAASLTAVKQQVAALEAAKHPILRSAPMQRAYGKYRKLAQEFDDLAQRHRKTLEKSLELLNFQKNLVSNSKTQIEEEYLAKRLQTELLKRQTLAYRVRQLAGVAVTLVGLPGKTFRWFRDSLQSGLLLRVITENWANLIGLLLFLVLLALATHRLRLAVVPSLEAWQSRVPELGLQILLAFLRVLVAHLFSLSLAAWLYLAFWALRIISTPPAWLFFSLVAVVVVLRLLLKIVRALFAGEAAGGLLPLPDELAPDESAYFRHLFQVVLLGWIFWLLRRRYLDRLMELMPVPGALKSPGFLQVVRGLAGFTLFFVVISGLLGFRFLSDYVAKAATFTVVVLFLAWIFGEGGYALLRLALHPELGFLIRKYPQEEKFFARLYQVLTRAVIILFMAAAVLATLRIWGIERAWLVWVFGWLRWGPSLGPVKLTPLNLGVTALVIYLGLWVSRVTRTIMELKFYPRTDWDAGIQYTISTTIHYVVLVITALIALNTLGVSFTSLALVAGGLGVGIGFGLQNIVSNFISGLILLYERPIKVGDMLVIDGQWGLVKEIRVRSTIFQTFDQYTLIIPNADLIAGKILNWTHFGWGLNRLTLKVGVSYGSDPRRVTQIIEEVCRANPRVVDDPPPQVFFEAYGDSSLNFNIWVHLSTPGDRIPATHELNSAIFEALRAHGIEIPFPQRDLHIKTWSPEASSSRPSSSQESG